MAFAFYGAPYDIVALGCVFIDVKVATKTHPGFGNSDRLYKFAPNNRHNEADLYMCIVASSEDVFFIPEKLIGDKKTIYLTWPIKRAKMGKYQKYHNRYDLIHSVYKEKKELA